MVSLIINWTNYLSDDQTYPIIYNTIFMTSGFAFVCSLVNIYLSKEFDENEKLVGIQVHDARNLFSIVSILFIYFGLLFELVYQTEKFFSWHIVVGISSLYSIYFITLILLFSKSFHLNLYTKYIIGLINLMLMFIYPLIVMMSDEILLYDQPVYYYFIYILYLIPFVSFVMKFLRQDEFEYLKPTPFSQWFIFGICTFVISYEVYNLYLITLATKNDLNAISHHIDIFMMIILPVVWTILGFLLIYIGLRQRYKNLHLMGFVLFSLIVLKLCCIDVWSMSNEFRIVSFIILGILILITSFIYQKLRKVVVDLLDKKGN